MDPGAHVQMYSTSNGSLRNHSQICNTSAPSTWLLVASTSGNMMNDVQAKTLHMNRESGDQVPGWVISDMFVKMAMVAEEDFSPHCWGIEAPQGCLWVGRNDLAESKMMARDPNV